MKKKFNRATDFSDAKENLFTTYKYREATGMVIRTIDYVFTAKSLEGGITGVHRYLAIPHERQIPAHGNPNANHPSDHYALGFEFTVNVA